MIASATPEHYRRAVQAILCSGEVDALIVIHVSPGVLDVEPFLQAIQEGTVAASGTGACTRPVLACLMPEQVSLRLAGSGQGRIPCYAFPEAPARVLGKLAPYAEWRTQPLGRVPDFRDADLSSARGVGREALDRRGNGWLSTEETLRILRAMRLPVAPGEVVRTPEEAVALARKLGFPVTLKLASHRLVHKSEVGGVCLNLSDEPAVRRAFEEICSRLARDNQLTAMDGVLVQSMVFGGTEVMVGVTQDPLFGPLVAFGLGGIHVEVLGDVCFRVTPLTNQDASEMVRGIRGHRLLQGYRGHPAADIPAIEEVLLRISRLVEEVPEVVELDLNPVFALPPGQGCRIVDARMRVERLT
jgi:acyl-CoA synthetase (NDP forming)